MRFADGFFHRHLTDAALTRALLAGERPAHLATCPACAERADALETWLGQLSATAEAAAEEQFPPERLAVQQAQILRRLEQADEPVRVLDFPAGPTPAPSAAVRSGVAPGWLAVAAAAGLAIGAVSGYLTAAGGIPAAESTRTEALVQPADVPAPAELPLELFDPSFDLAPAALRDLDEATPSIVPAQYALR